MLRPSVEEEEACVTDNETAVTELCMNFKQDEFELFNRPELTKPFNIPTKSLSISLVLSMTIQVVLQLEKRPFKSGLIPAVPYLHSFISGSTALCWALESSSVS
jgi:hypothetical protein